MPHTQKRAACAGRPAPKDCSPASEHQEDKQITRAHQAFDVADSFALPFPPPVNNLYASYGNRRIRTRRYEAWLTEAALTLRAQTRQTLLGRFTVEITFHRPDRRKRDLDGLAKAILDLLTKQGVIVDDSLADKVTLEWADHPPTQPGAAVVTLKSKGEVI